MWRRQLACTNNVQIQLGVGNWWRMGLGDTQQPREIIQRVVVKSVTGADPDMRSLWLVPAVPRQGYSSRSLCGSSGVPPPLCGSKAYEAFYLEQPMIWYEVSRLVPPISPELI